MGWASLLERNMIASSREARSSGRRLQELVNYSKRQGSCSEKVDEPVQVDQEAEQPKDR